MHICLEAYDIYPLVSSCFTMGNAHYWKWFRFMMDILWCHHALQWVMPTIGNGFGL
jgi:hypothetical protein